MNDDWTKDDTERWLGDFPLPADFLWNGLKVQPTHRVLKGGYGKWLRETPYHPGLFDLAHEILAEVSVGQPMPSLHELVRKITERAARPRGQTELTDQPTGDEPPFG